MIPSVQVHADVLAAQRAGTPVVALESTIFSHLGLPSPHNAEALDRCRRAITDAGAVPALTAVIDGQMRVGLDPADDPRVLGPATKTSARELAAAVVAAEPVGATTVSASLTLAARAGIEVFATGGIGGVHLGADQSFDVSADLDAIARHPVVTVCAGPKYFLDLAATLEVLETANVPVVGLGTDELPAFYSPHSGLPVPVRVDSADAVARLARTHWSLGGGGVLVTVPIPDAAALPRAELDEVLERAMAEAGRRDLRGAAITPVVLEATASLTGGRSVQANLALAEHNAAIAARIAGSLLAH